MQNPLDKAALLNNPLWQSACEHYQHAPLAQTLLRLQDNHGCHINLLLCLCWLGDRGVVVHSKELTLLQQAVGENEAKVLQPLRSIRRRLKDKAEFEQEYQRLKQIELQLEQHQLAELYRVSLDFPVSQIDNMIAQNLEAYAQLFSSVNIHAEFQSIRDLWIDVNE